MAARLSVIICCHNRARDVGLCLAALAPQIDWDEDDIILVDSASDPTNVAALKGLATVYPRIRQARLEQPGLSLARNRGAAMAESEWLAFLDDDATPAPDWMATALELMRTAPPTVAAIGGSAAPEWPPGAKVDHIGRRWRALLSLLEDQGAGAWPEPYKICGVNFLIRRSELAAVGGFPLGLGRIGDKLLGGEETFVFASLKANGLEVRYDSRLHVEHRIPPDRIEKAWAERRAFWEGMTEVALQRALRQPTPVHLWTVKVLASAPVLALLHAIKPAGHDYFLRLQCALGVLRGKFMRISSV